MSSKILIFLASISVLQNIACVTDPMKFFVKLGQFETSSTSTYYTSTYYGSRDFRLVWSDAFMFCKSFGMELLILETVEEQNFVLNLLSSSWTTNFLEQFTHIGGTNLGSPSWYWAATGKSIDYTIQWHQNQPDNARDVEVCMSIMYTPGVGIGLNDCECTTTIVIGPAKFICEKVTTRPAFLGHI